MNQKNIDALKASLLSIVPRGRLSKDEIQLIAVSMANGGVLAPSALSEEELVSCGKPESDLPTERAEVAAFVRERLERIAKGDTRLDATGEWARMAANMPVDQRGTSILQPPKTSDPS